MNIKTCLTAALLMVCIPAFADDATDPFQAVVSQYRAANPKPALPEEARKYGVQAEFMQDQQQPDRAIQLYGKALEIAPWWPDGHYQLGVLLAQARKYRAATIEMQRYLQLVPNGSDARAAQDNIYKWEVAVEIPVPVVAKPVAAGKTFSDCPNCAEMVEIPAGSFDMGTDSGEANEKPMHHVNITHSFAIGKTEVTQQQWHDIMNNNPSYFSACGNTCPVEQVSWNDVQEFIEKLNARTGKHYRLPSEAEWEYACRAGTADAYCGSDNVDQVSWNDRNSGSFFFNAPHPVAGKRPNAFGLYDMSGNVWEWVADEYHDNYSGAPADGSAWMDGSMHVLRGGGWGSDAEAGRVTSRFKFAGNVRYYSYGFRLARDLP